MTDYEVTEAAPPEPTPFQRWIMMAHIDAATPYKRHERSLLDRARHRAPGKAWWSTLSIVMLALFVLAATY